MELEGAELTTQTIELKTNEELEQELRTLVSNARAYNAIGVSNLAKEAMDFADRVHKILMDRHQAMNINRGIYR